MDEKGMIDELRRAVVVLQNAPMRQIGYASLEDPERHEMSSLLVEVAESLTKRLSPSDTPVRSVRRENDAVAMSPSDYREISRATANMATVLDVMNDNAPGRELLLAAYGQIIGTLSAIRTRDGREL